MAGPDYLQFVRDTDPQTLRESGYDYAKKMADQTAQYRAGNQFAAGDWGGVSGTLARAGNIQGAQQATSFGQAQTAYSARQQAAGDVVSGNYDSARQAAARTGSLDDVTKITGLQKDDQQRRAQGLLAATRAIAAIPEEPGDATGDPSTGRAKRIAQLAPVLQSALGLSPQAAQGLISEPKTTQHLEDVQRALIAPFSGTLKKDEVAVQNGQTVATNYAPESVPMGNNLFTRGIDGKPVLAAAGQVKNDVIADGVGGVHVVNPYSGAQVNAIGGSKPMTVKDAYGNEQIVDVGSGAGGAPQGAPSPAIRQFAPQIGQAEQKYGLPQGLLSSVIGYGEHGHVGDVSPKGARGLAQFMPATAAQYGVNPDDPASSIDGAARYLSDLAKQFGGDWTKAVQAYNAGPGRVASGNIPAETQAYAQRVQAAMQGGQGGGSRVLYSTAQNGGGASQNLDAQAKAIVEGRLPAPTGIAASRPLGQMLLQKVTGLDPTFDFSNAAGRVATRRDFMAGPTSKNITALNTALGHIDSLDGQIDKLAHTSIPMVNGVLDMARTATGDPRVKQFNVNKQAVKEEVARVFKGAGGTVSELAEWERAMDTAGSPAQLRAVTREAARLIGSRLDALSDTWQRGMGMDDSTAPPIAILSPHGQAVMQRLAPSSAAPSAPAGGPDRTALIAEAKRRGLIK